MPPQTDQDKTGVWIKNYDGSYGTSYPDGDKPNTDNFIISVDGSGYGAGPTVLLFDRMNGTPGAGVYTGRTPDVGEWTAVSSYGEGEPQLYEYLGETWLANRDINNIANSGERNRHMYMYTGPITEFDFSMRTVVPDGFRFPDAPTPGAHGDDSSSKMTWFSQGLSNGSTLLGRDSPYRNLCIPSAIDTAAIAVAGNQNNPMYFNEYARLMYANWSLTSPNFYNWYQSGAGTYDTYDQVGEFICFNAAVAQRATQMIDPFHAPSSGVESSFSTRSYSAFELPGWFVDSYNYINCLQLFRDIRLAVGNNSRAKVFVSNSAIFLTAGQIYHGDIISWDNSNGVQFRIDQGSDFGENMHVHIMRADGTLFQDVPFTRGV